MRKKKRFTFHEYLKNLPPPIIFKYLVTQINAERKIISSKYIQKISDDFLTKNYLSTNFASLSTEAKKYCVATYLTGAGGLLHCSYPETHETLLSSFLIYSATNRENRKLDFGFQEIEEILADEFVSFLHDCAKVTIREDFSRALKPLPFFPLRCLNDFMVILLLALQGELRKRADSQLINSSMNRLHTLLQGDSRETSPEEYEPTNQPILDLLISYGLDNRLLSCPDKLYETSHEQITNWLSRPYQDMYQHFIDYAVAYMGEWNISLLQTLLSSYPDTWYSFSFLPEAGQEFLNCKLSILHYVGLIDMVQLEEAIYFKHHPPVIPQNYLNVQNKVTILPDFSALIPQETSPQTLYAFCQCGSLNSLDQVYQGSITRTSIIQSLTNGVSGPDIEKYLHSWETPRNIIETVKEWIREFSRLSIINTEIIASFDEQTSAQLKAYQPIKDFINEVSCTSVFTIKKGYERYVHEILKKMGFDPRIPDSKTTKGNLNPDIFVFDEIEELTLSLDFTTKEKPVQYTSTVGKYGEELKELDLNETYHVIDYALLTGNILRIEYVGCPDLEAGVYSFTPLKVKNCLDAEVEGKLETGETIKCFKVKKIKKIGVKSQ